MQIFECILQSLKKFVLLLKHFIYLYLHKVINYKYLFKCFRYFKIREIYNIFVCALRIIHYYIIM